MTTQSHSLARIPTLDGWRGVAIIMVLIAHFQMAYLHHFFFGMKWLDLGQHGVTVFFVLSGYLITTGLLSQEKINLRLFYTRRFFRIMPAAFTYLLFLILLTQFTPMKTIGSDLWGCLLSYRNYLGETPLNTCTLHFWSLSVEEQFYFVWPAVLALLGRRYGAIFAASGALLIAAFRMFRWDYYLQDLRNQHTEVRADALLVGCLLALALQHQEVRNIFRSAGKWLFAGGFLIAIVDIYRFESLPPLHESIAIAIMIGATVLNPWMLAGRALEMEHLKTVGLMSYSIYLWQGLFLRDGWGTDGFVLLAVSAVISWAVIERMGIKAGKRIISRWNLPVAQPEPASI